MQCKFLIAFVLMGSCLIQATSAQPSIGITGMERGLIDNAIGEIKKLIEEVQALVNQQIKESVKNLEALKDKASQLVNEAIETMKQKLQEHIQKAQEDIEKIKEKAIQAGIDISDCIKQNQDRFPKLFQEFLANEVQCVTVEIDKVQQMIDDAVNTITNMADTIKNTPNELQNCITNNKNPFVCIMQLAQNLVEMKINCFTQSAKTVTDVTEFVSGLQARLQTCAAKQLINAGVAATRVVTDITKCAAEKGLQLFEQ